MVFLARICKKHTLAPEKMGLASELFLVLSTPAINISFQTLSDSLDVIHNSDFRNQCSFKSP
jgi:hypothetical protein